MLQVIYQQNIIKSNTFIGPSFYLFIYFCICCQYLLDPARRYTCPVAGNYILYKYPNRPNTIYNTELNDFRTIVYLRKSEVTVERISVCNAIEKLEHGIQSMLQYE